jgi:hypothetical protein
MLFQVVHTHNHETCPAQSSENLERASAWWNALKNTPGIKVLGGYVAPIEHVFYVTVEAEDSAALVRGMGPLNTIGTGQISPIVSLDQAFPMAQEGAFRMQ